MTETSTNESTATALTRIAGTVAACISLVALVLELPGMHAGQGLWQPVPRLGGLGAALCGIGLSVAAHRRHRWVASIGAVVLSLSSAILVRHGLTRFFPGASDAHLTADRWLLGASPAIGLSLLLVALALSLSLLPPRLRWKPATMATLGSAVTAFALVSLLLQTLDPVTSLASGTPSRLPALLAVAFLCLGLGTMSHAAAHSPRHRVRRSTWLPISVGLGLVTFTVVVWRALIAFDRVHVERVMATAALGLRTHIVGQLRGESDALQRMANRWEIGGGTPRELWEADASAFVGDRPGVLGVLWIDPQLTPRWGIPYAADDASTTTLFQLPAPRQALATTREARHTTLSSGFVTPRRAQAFLVCVPLVIDRKFDGLLVAIMRVQEFLDDILTDSVLQGYAVIVQEGNRTIYGPAEFDEQSSSTATVRIELSGLDWRLIVLPRAGTRASADSALPEVTLVVGLLMSALVALTMHLGQMAAQRARELEVVNVGLERRVEARTAELQRALSDLERSNQDLEQFAYVASHDLQEPLRMVSSYVQLLARRYRGRLDADADDFIHYAVDGAERMKRLINDLLAYSRLGTRSQAIRLVDCGAILQAALSNLSLAIEEAGATITHDPLPQLPADETQLLQLIQNLIGNAIKFRGTEPPHIHLGVTREEAFWHFVVRDNGIGIDPQYADRIFVIFRRLHTQKEYPGTGIGLALCKKIVERHGGRIWVESQADKGSAFHFTLPAEPPEALPSSAQARPDRRAGLDPEGNA